MELFDLQFKAMNSISGFSLRLLIVLSIIIIPNVSPAVEAFTGTYGINYGRIADNIPSPDKVVRLLRAAKIKNVRIYDADQSVLQAFSGSGLELVIGLPNGFVKEMSYNPDHALTWVKENVQAFLPGTNIVGIAVGNEVLGGSDDSLWEHFWVQQKIFTMPQKSLNYMT